MGVPRLSPLTQSLQTPHSHHKVTVGSLDLSANKDIKQDVIVCEDRDKYSNLLRSLKENNTGGKVLIFVETKRGCDQLQRSLQMDGWTSCAIHGDKTQQVRACLPACVSVSVSVSVCVPLPLCGYATVVSCRVG